MKTVDIARALNVFQTVVSRFLKYIERLAVLKKINDLY